jgi:LuxR family transcriptional regulator, quorum-sensing system regulator SdiA
MTLVSHCEAFSLAAPAGFYLALHVGYAFPEREVNRLPVDWIEFYTKRGLLVHDPVMRWVYSNTGAMRIEDLLLPDPEQVLVYARRFCLRYGAVVSILRRGDGLHRSYATFYRTDCAFTLAELSVLQQRVEALHDEVGGNQSLTPLEVETLRMLSRGMRVKQIAQEAGISDSAVKARLLGARRKTGARTTSQLLTVAAARRLI